MITNLFILICLAIFIYINFISQDDKTYCALKLGAFYPPNVRERHEYYRFITCHFIHIDFLHFLMNAYALYDLGSFFEYMFGTVPYLCLVIASMLLSSLLCYSASEIFESSNATITIGASGVVYGFFGAICVLYYFAGGVYGEIFSGFIPVIIINFLYTFMNSQISKTGHLGGFIGGIVATVLMMVMKVI